MAAIGKLSTYLENIYGHVGIGALFVHSHEALIAIDQISIAHQFAYASGYCGDGGGLLRRFGQFVCVLDNCGRRRRGCARTNHRLVIVQRHEISISRCGCCCGLVQIGATTANHNGLVSSTTNTQLRV